MCASYFVTIETMQPFSAGVCSQKSLFQIRRAVINRYGFNSKGADAARQRLAAFRTRQEEHGPAFPAGLIGVNLGKNKTSPDAAADYVAGVHALAEFADYLVINISSPNTPGLRALQGRTQLEGLVKAVKVARDGMAWGPAGPPPLLVKIAPDLTAADKSDIAAVVKRTGVDGLIISNTTIERPGPIAAHAHGGEAGGLSGAPLFGPSTEVLREMYTLTGGKVPIVGVGGVASGRDAYDKIRAGASLVELYTAFVYDGPSLVPRIKRELAECLKADGFGSVAEAVGADHRQPAKKKWFAN